MVKHWDIKVFGDVQGVFFRYSAKEKAEELGLTGFARNEADGSVHIEAEGEEDALRVFWEWCKKGPASANIINVEQAEGEIKGYGEFSMQ